jgi:hypothetical protein
MNSNAVRLCVFLRLHKLEKGRIIRRILVSVFEKGKIERREEKMETRKGEGYI